MVGGDVGGGDQNRGLGDGGELRDGGGACPTQHHIGGGHHQGHIIDVLPNLDARALQSQAPAADLLLHPAIVPPGPVDVVEGGSVIAFTGNELAHLPVHHLRPQGTPVGQQKRPLIGQPQLFPGLLPGIAEKVAPHRGSGDHHLLRVVIVAPALLKAHHHPVHHLGQSLGGQAGHGVGLVDGGGDVPPGGLLHYGVGGVAPGAHHQIRLKFVQDAGRLLLGSDHVPHRAQVVGDIRRREGAVKIGDGHRADLIALFGDQVVFHPAIRSHEQDLAVRVPLLEDPGQRHRRIDMSRRAAAGKKDIHGITPLSRLGRGRALRRGRPAACLPPDQSFLGAGICLDMLNTIPISASWIISAVPP